MATWGVTWGVLQLPAGVDAAAHAGDGAVAASVAQHLDGLVAAADGTTVSGLLALLPTGVTRIVLLDPETATDPDAEGLLASVLAADDGTHAAVCAARPLADALKRVEDDVVVEGFARDDVLTPVAPVTVARGVLDGLDVPDGAALGEVAGLLLAAGRAIRLVPGDGDPVTVRVDGPMVEVS